jgi:uncharacterized membrane protein YfcA
VLFAIGALIGLALGLTGAGGSVLAVPLLMLLGGFNQGQAAGLSLAAVGLSAALGVVLRLGRQQVAWWPALVLAGMGVVFAPAGQWLARLLPEDIVLASFALLVVVVAVRLWRSARRDPESAKEVRASAGEGEDARPAAACARSESGYFEMRWPCVSRLVWVGALTGLVSGLYGVGGGFVIVPALILLTAMSMRQAVATSLVVITLVSLSGFISFLVQTHVPLASTGFLVGGACAGMLAGTGVARYVAGARLQETLAVALVVLVMMTLYRTF